MQQGNLYLALVFFTLLLFVLYIAYSIWRRKKVEEMRKELKKKEAELEKIRQELEKEHEKIKKEFPEKPKENK